MATKENKAISNVILARTETYDITSKIKDRLLKTEKSHILYHVWLKCLYNPDVTFADVQSDLLPVLKKASVLARKDVFIVPHEGEPAGSCYVNIEKGHKLKSNIFQTRTHMIESNITVVRNLIKENCLVFRHSYPIGKKQLTDSSSTNAKNPPLAVTTGANINNTTVQNNHNGLNHAQEPRPSLVKIGTTERAKSILEQTPANCTFLRFRSTGLKNLSLVSMNEALLNSQALNSSYDRIQWQDIFINGNGVNASSGIVLLKDLNILKQQWRDILIKKKELEFSVGAATMRVKLADQLLFRGSIMNVLSCWEHRVAEVAAKRKSSPLISFNDDSDSESARLVIDETPRMTDEATTKKQKHHSTSREFVPVTFESIRFALGLIEQYEKQNRTVRIVFDICFNDINVTLDEIRKKFEPLFGRIDEGCVLIKSSLNQLMPNLTEAYNREYILRGQAYIIGPKELNPKDFNQRASEQNILYGSMTMSCVAMNLKKGVYVMHKDALIQAGAPLQLVLQQVGHDTSSHEETKPSNGKAVNTSRSSSLESFEKKLKTKMDADIEKNEVVTKLLPDLSRLGNVVIRLEKLPGKLTVHALNLMMGTFTISGDRVLAVKTSNKKGNELLNMRIVFKSDNGDIQRILDKNKFKTVYDEILLVQRTDLKELEKFLTKHHNNLYKLPTSDKLPINQIGYGKKR